MFLFSTAILVAPVGLVFLLSLRSWRLPFRLSSDPARTPSKPAVFYVLEDVVAVDFKHGKKWRVTLRRRCVKFLPLGSGEADARSRYEASPMFRSLIKILMLYWAFEAAFFIGITAAVTWTTPFVPSHFPSLAC